MRDIVEKEMPGIGSFCYNLVDNGMRLVGPLFVLLALALIGGVIYVLVYFIIPFYSIVSIQFVYASA